MGSRGLSIGVVGGATAAEALRLLAELRPDLFLAEIDSEDDPEETLRAIGRARELAPGLAVIVLATAARDDFLLDAGDPGASGRVDDTESSREAAAAGPQSLRDAAFRRDSRGGDIDGEPDPGLTPRELEALALAAQGCTNAEIARTLWVSLETVKSHLSSVYRKLGAANRTEAARWAQLHGIVPRTPLAGGAAGAADGASRSFPHPAARPIAQARLRSAS